MRKIFSTFIAFAALFFALVACSDEEEGTEFLFDREIMEMSVLRSCADEGDSSACYRIRYHYPIEREHYSGLVVWLDTFVVDDTSKAVSSKQIDKATQFIEYPKGTSSYYDTLDLTDLVQEYIGKYDSLQVALFCKYSDDKDPGSVQRVFLHFGDDLPPSRVTIFDSVWTNGALFEWFRPTDQVDFYKPAELSGEIVGYNVVIYSADKNEDLRNLKVILTTADGVDSTGSKFYRRHSRIRANTDSVWFDSVSHTDKDKNYLRLSIIDGKGFDADVDSLNRFRMVIRGLQSKSEYTIGLSAWDAAGNSSGTEGLSTVETNQLFITTDSVAPVMPTRIFILEDSLFPGKARLDSNNRLRIFWSMSVDPYEVKHPIKSDSIVLIPDTCLFTLCYDTVQTYIIERYSALDKNWKIYDDTTLAAGRFSKRYALDGDTMVASATGIFVTDTIRWVSPGDTIVFRIRSKDKSGYYSAALVDTVYVSPGALASELECPEGFVPVSVSDSSKFCMEKFEHRNDSGEFVVNVRHSEAVAACEAVSASGFKVSLCNERDWELVCLSGGSLSYGVLNELSVDASSFLFGYCNVGTNDSISAADISKRNPRCVNPDGIRDLPGQYQEWVIGKSEDTSAVVKGSSFKIYNGLDRESLAYCTNRSFPYFTRPAYSTDTIFLYREGTKVDTLFQADTSRTPYEKKPYLTMKDFKDTLQFFDVLDSNGNSIGTDYALYSEYRKGGDAWLDTLANGLKYVPSEIKVVFLTGEMVPYRLAASFYKSTTIGFRCCAYPE